MLWAALPCLLVACLSNENKTLKALDEHNRNSRKHRDHKNDKVGVVFNANTIVDPGTVVVKSFNAAITHRAVLAATRPDCEAVGAKLSAVNHFQQMQKVVIVFFQIARVSCD